MFADPKRTFYDNCSTALRIQETGRLKSSPNGLHTNTAQQTNLYGNTGWRAKHNNNNNKWIKVSFFCPRKGFHVVKGK